MAKMTTGEGSAAVATLLLLVSSLLAGGGVDACDGVASMSRDEACNKACGDVSPPLVQRCQALLADWAPDPAEVTTFALAAAAIAKGGYEASVRTVDQQLENPAIHADARAAYDACKNKYRDAHALVSTVFDQLSACNFADARQEYVDASVNVRTCGAELVALTASPLLDQNLDDQNKTTIANGLLVLITGKFLVNNDA